MFYWKYLNIKFLLILGQNKHVNNKTAIKWTVWFPHSSVNGLYLEEASRADFTSE